MNINDLKLKNTSELITLTKYLNIKNINRLSKQEIIFLLLNEKTKKGENLKTEGILEIIQDGFGFLRTISNSFLPGPDDIYISPNQIKRFNLRTGDEIKGKIRSPKSSEKFFALQKIEKINGEKPDTSKNKVFFDNLTPLHVCKKFDLETGNGDSNDINTRIIELISPLGKGQRALLVSPPKSGKTTLLQNIASSITINHKKTYLIVLLIDERPEEVTEMVRSVDGEVIASTFDEPAIRHIQVAEIVIERAKRLVERKMDVMILLDSITRLSRAYNTFSPSSGKVLTGGVDSSALQRPKRFFGAARNVEEGGSLSIIATTLIDTGSKMDDIIFEEFKGTGNAEIYLNKKIFEKQIFPSISVEKSGTRKEELIIKSDTLQKMWVLKKILHPMDDIKALEFLIKHLKSSKTNKLLFKSMANLLK